MKAGKLSERFCFDKREPLTAPGDAYGVSEGEWIEQVNCAAEKIVLRRGETVIASRLSGVQPYVLRIRYSSKSKLIETDWRARDFRSGEKFNIRTVERHQKDGEIHLLIDGGPGVAVG